MDEAEREREIRKLGIIKETSVRLFNDALVDGYLDKAAKKNADRLRESIADAQKRRPGLDYHAAYSEALFEQLSIEKSVGLIQQRVQGKMLEILFKWLSESSQREAIKEMRSLTAEEVFKDPKDDKGGQSA